MAAAAPKWSLEIHHIDVGGGYPGRGDSTLIVTQNDAKVPIVRSVLIDGGLKKAGTLVDTYIKRVLGLNNPLTAIVVTHYDQDHLGGITSILETANKANDAFYKNVFVYDQGIPLASINDKNYLDYISQLYFTPDEKTVKNRRFTWLAASDKDKSLREYYRAMNLVQQGLYKKIFKGAEWYTKQAHAPFDLIGQDILRYGIDEKTVVGMPSFKCVAANEYVLNERRRLTYAPTSLLDTKNPNSKSLAFLLEFNNFKYYIGGDLESPQEDILCEYLNPQDSLSGRIQAVKLSHHGSKNSSSTKFLERLRPKATFISCGLFNKYPHPSPELIKRLNSCAYGYSSAVFDEIEYMPDAKLETCYLTGYPIRSFKDLLIEDRLQNNDPYIVAGTYVTDKKDGDNFVMTIISTSASGKVVFLKVNNQNNAPTKFLDSKDNPIPIEYYDDKDDKDDDDKDSEANFETVKRKTSDDVKVNDINAELEITLSNDTKRTIRFIPFNIVVAPYTPGHIVINVTQQGSLISPLESIGYEDNPVFTVACTRYVEDVGADAKGNGYKPITGQH